MSNQKRVAVVILNWNGSNMMRQFLPSVVKGTGEDGEVIVADNGSSDDSCDMLSREFPNIKQIRLPKNYGFAEGYNQALKQTDAEFFLLLNSDVEVSEGWLKPLLEYMDSHQDVAACQPKILRLRSATGLNMRARREVSLTSMVIRTAADASLPTLKTMRGNMTTSPTCCGPQGRL